MSRFSRSLGVLAGLLLSGSLAQAQTGSITGTVTDQAGGKALAGARVQAAGSSYFATTNQLGQYTIRAVAVGPTPSAF